MTGYKSSGATPRAWFPGAWRFYDGLVASFALILMVVNALIGVDVFPANVDRWIGVGITAITALLIWMRLRATQLGVVKVNGQPTPDDGEPDDPKDLEDPTRC